MQAVEFPGLVTDTGHDVNPLIPMNWPRGLFRLWAVTSLVWVIGTGIIILQDPFWERYPTARSAAEITALPPGTEYIWEMDGTIQKTLDRGMHYMPDYHPPGTPGYQTPLLPRYPDSRALILLAYALIVFFPPLAIVFVARIAAWIFVGFVDHNVSDTRKRQNEP